MRHRTGVLILLLSVSSFCFAVPHAKPAASVAEVAARVHRGPGKLKAGPAMIRGTVAKVSGNEVDVKTATGSVRIKLSQPFRVYARVPGRLTEVKNASFVGVTSVKQRDGTQKATEIHVFAPELRGMGEGSHMMNPSPNPSPSRMTNGSVSAPRMTNGTTSKSRMSNGSVQRKGASSIIVTYRGGSQSIAVPPGVTVTDIKPSRTKLRVGDNVVMMVQSDAHGELSSSKAIRSGKKSADRQN